MQSVAAADPPGTRWQYGGLGYLTLGILIHHVTGRFCGDFLQTRIFRPLGMATTLIISGADLVPHRSAGCRRVYGQTND